MDQIINWLLLIIIFVFDPLAIALVVAANFAFAQLKPEEEWDEEHALDMVLNDMVKQVEKEPEVKIVEKIVEVPIEVEKIVEKNVYGEDIEEKLKILELPRIKEAIRHAKKNKEI